MMESSVRYDELLRSPRLDHDPWSRPNLETFRPRHLKICEAIGKYLEGPGNSIADIGCHNGFFLRLASTLGFERFVAVDYFEIAGERSFLSELNGVEFLTANFNEDYFLQPLRDKSLDVVVSTEVFEHIYHHPLGYLHECMRVLRPGGLLLLSTPNPCTLANAARLVVGKEISWGSVKFALTPKLDSEGAPPALWDIHFREYTQDALREIIGKLDGAEIVEQGFLANGVRASASLVNRLAISFVSKSAAWDVGDRCVRLNI